MLSKGMIYARKGVWKHVLRRHQMDTNAVAPRIPLTIRRITNSCENTQLCKIDPHKVADWATNTWSVEIGQIKTASTSPTCGWHLQSVNRYCEKSNMTEKVEKSVKCRVTMEMACGRKLGKEGMRLGGQKPSDKSRVIWWRERDPAKSQAFPCHYLGVESLS